MRSSSSVPAIDSRTPPSTGDQPALRQLADAADVDGQRDTRRRTHGVLAQHPFDDNRSGRRDTVEPSGQRRSIDPAGIARPERQPGGDRARDDQRRGFPGVVQQERRDRREPEQRCSCRRSGSANSAGRRWKPRIAAAAPASSGSATSRAGAYTTRATARSGARREHERNGGRAGQARRRCDPVTPSRWQFLRGIPAAPGRSGPRCEWP